jgi:hypothetical protein
VKTIGIVEVAALAAVVAGARNDHTDVAGDQLGGQRRQTIAQRYLMATFADHRHCSLLVVCTSRPSNRSSAEQEHQFAPVNSVTSLEYRKLLGPLDRGV